MNARLLLFIYILAGCTLSRAQEHSSVFNFLSLPASSHAIALGGKNISHIEDDASLVFQNPSLLSSVSDRNLNLNFMTYMQGSKMGSAAFVKTAGERGTWGLTTQFVGYGTMTETLETGEVIGHMKALDMALGGGYSYELTDRWAGGATGKFIYSKYGHYTSAALAVDLGMNYFNDEKDLSLSFVAANLGGQVKAFGDKRERLPFSLQWGITKGMAHAPIRFSLTLIDLTRWSKSDYYSPDKAPSAGRILMNHLNVGLDIQPSRTFYFALGYNFRRAYEMKAAGSSHAAGFTCGAGLTLRKFKLGLAYAKYHVSAPSLACSLNYVF